MIPERNANVVSSNMVGETVQMGIDAAATAHVMSLLTNAYADPELAIIREPATNALDSHVAAGTVGPIEVETPTSLRPTLVIRDFGLGLDAHDIRDLYSQYGASTKRETNNATGMLGIGCKAPLAYTDQFTVTAVKGGHRIVVAIGRDEEGGGTMTVLDQHATDAPNGVEVSIPAKRVHNQLAEKAAAFFSYWEPGTVLLDGVEPPAPEGWRASERFLVEPGERLRGFSPASERLRVLMGNIAYPAPDGYENSILQTLAPGYRLVAKVPIGTVSFAPSREALFDNAATRRAIDALLDEFAAARVAQIDRELSTAASAAEAYARATAIRETYREASIKWRGEVVPTRVSAKVRVNKVNRYNTGRTHTTDADSLTVSDAERAIWVMDFPGQRWSATQRAKLFSYLKAHGKGPNSEIVVITHETEIPDERWLTTKPVRVVWEDVKSWRDPEKAKPRAKRDRYAGTYPAVSEGRESVALPASEIDTEKPIYYSSYGAGLYTARQYQIFLGEECTVVDVVSSRQAKFLRLFPTAESANKAARRKAEGIWAAFTAADKRHLALRQTMYLMRHEGLFSELSPDKIKDPDIRTLIAAAKAEDVDERAAAISAWSSIDTSPPAAKAEKFEALTERIHERYPLIPRDGNAKLVDHVTSYLNAAHAAWTKEAA